MLKKSKSGSSVDEVIECAPYIRSVTIWCLAIFNPDKPGPPRVWAFLSSDDLLKMFCIYKDSSLFPVTFSRQLFVSPGHPLYSLGEPLRVKNGQIVK